VYQCFDFTGNRKKIDFTGYLFFASPDEFKEYVKREILASQLQAVAD